MRCTLLGELVFFKKDQIESLNRTVKFLHARGIFRDYKEDDFWYSEDPKKIINIELIEVPIIFEKLKEISYFQRYDCSVKNIENVKNNIFMVNVLELSETGLYIYFDYPTSENIVFISSNQISCIHNISEVKFNKISGWKRRLLAKEKRIIKISDDNEDENTYNEIVAHEEWVNRQEYTPEEQEEDEDDIDTFCDICGDYGCKGFCETYE